MQNTGAYSSYSHRCNPNDLGALYGFSRRLITHQIHDWPLADANFTNCCSWPGVSRALFSSSPISSSSSTNSSGLSVTRVVGLDLSGKGLDGVLSTSLAVLDKLSFLNLSYNFIPRPHPAGAIPLEALEGARPRQKPLVRRATTGCSKPHKASTASMSLTTDSPGTFLRNLEVFSAKSNGFMGRLPASLSLCSMLRSLDLWNNSLDGSIDLDFRRLVRLTTLNLGYNRLRGLAHPGGEEMPRRGIRGFPNLRSVTVGNCGLTGNPGLYSVSVLFCNSTLSAANHKEGDGNDEDKFVFFGVPFAVYLFMCRWDRNYDYD
ncbi:hypothetical protein B296_00021752 [Ensete ventricosum]|uniref:Leucine-rich repeat-containing N-terminal plant-type domain-containing protein n=1 Tax=Ensete ventricosum TaxID=4639 RepID=A0A426Y0F1_ENSVE|nr:hypothetical protein B296_00021752 [Ensete ventricosum]